MESRDTEQHIKETAKRIFFFHGKLNAKTQEIADEANVNRALLHYYFRSREKLFETVLKEALDEVHRQTFDIISSDLSFEVKVESIVSHLIDRMVEYPYMESFIISELIRKPENLIMIHNARQDEEFKKKFKKETQEYIDKNKLPHMKPEHFLANMLALCSYPSVTKPMLMNIFKYDDSQFRAFIQERKHVITKLLLGKKS